MMNFLDTQYARQFFADVSKITQSLERIAQSLEKQEETMKVELVPVISRETKDD